MVPDLITKLKKTLQSRSVSEEKVVYALVAIRKILEQEENHNQYEFLKFHIDWGLHAFMDRQFTQKLLDLFNQAHIHLSEGLKLSDLPTELRRIINDISSLKKFQSELSEFLKAHNLPDCTHSNFWPKFLLAYANVVKDCPLILRGSVQDLQIEKIVIDVEVSPHKPYGETYYKINWNLFERNGEAGQIFVMHSYS